jgi:hypothetical protein
VVVERIAKSATDDCLNILAQFETSTYPVGDSINDRELADLNLKPHSFHCDRRDADTQ